ncbi:hypothetical protein [Nocardia sp. CA-119907]|uniref:hypothetical protein n=1 Tax=Nocardia sp. CA-119907 TaxID=3239973 RepID=UPI003D99C215
MNTKPVRSPETVPKAPQPGMPAALGGSAFADRRVPCLHAAQVTAVPVRAMASLLTALDPIPKAPQPGMPAALGGSAFADRRVPCLHAAQVTTVVPVRSVESPTTALDPIPIAASVVSASAASVATCPWVLGDRLVR